VFHEFVIRIVVNKEQLIDPFFKVMMNPFKKNMPFVFEARDEGNGHHVSVILSVYLPVLQLRAKPAMPGAGRKYNPLTPFWLPSLSDIDRHLPAH